MSDEETKVTAPTVAELEGKVERLATQATADSKAVTGVDETVKRAMKSGDLDEVLKATDARSALLAAFNKSESQLKTARNAVVSGKRAANAGKIAEAHNAMRADGKLIAHFDALRALGVEWTKVEVSEETGKWIFNSGGAEVKRTRGSGGGGTKGQTLTVDGTEYASASAAIRAFFPDSGPLNRESIISKLTNAGHEVS